MQKKKLIVGNWKMDPQTAREVTQIMRGIAGAARLTRGASVAICPSFMHLPVLSLMRMKSISLGAQDIFWEKEGAYTGEVSAEMLRDAKARFVIIGHSERRALGDTDEDISRKMRAALASGLTPILCVGEPSRDNEGSHITFVRDQLRSALQGIKRSDAEYIVVAYEPIWAIGKKAVRPATTEEGMEMAIVIRKTLTDIFDRATADNTQILYGGSVNGKNAREFLFDAGMDGLLVGRASLSPKSFSAIIASATPLKKVIAKKAVRRR